jgi:hypothetical protein
MSVSPRCGVAFAEGGQWEVPSLLVFLLLYLVLDPVPFLLHVRALSDRRQQV